MYTRLSRFVSGMALVAMVFSFAPSAFAGGSDAIAVQLVGSVNGADTVQLNWGSLPDYVSVEGYAVFMRKNSDSDVSWARKPFARLKHSSGSDTSYMLAGMPSGTYVFQVAAYNYDVNVYSFSHYSNEVRLQVGATVDASAANVPAPQTATSAPQTYVPYNVAQTNEVLQLTGSVKDCMMTFHWTTLPETTNDVEGYAVFLKKSDDANAQWFKKPFALLKKANNNYNYYNLSGMPAGSYTAKVASYDYDITGYKFANYSNEVTVDYTSCGTTSTPASTPVPTQTSVPVSVPTPTPVPATPASVPPLPVVWPTAFDVNAAVPTIIQPTSGQVLTNFPRRATLQWTSIAGAAHYEAQVQCDLCGASLWSETPMTIKTAHTYYITEPLAGDNEFRVRVRAIGPEGVAGAWSEYTYFRYKTGSSALPNTAVISPTVDIPVQSTSDFQPMTGVAATLPQGIEGLGVPKNTKPPKWISLQKLYAVGGMTDDGVILHYGFVHDEDENDTEFDQYMIERWEVGSGRKRSSKTRRVFYTDPSQNVFTDTRVLAGRTYAYRVSAVTVSDSGVDVVASSNTAPVVFVSNKNALELAGSYNAASGKISLHWNGGAKGPSFSGYAVYVYAGDQKVDLSALQPIILPKKMKNISFTVDGSGGAPSTPVTYHFKVYQYQMVPKDGAYVFHQPGSDLIDVVVP